MRRSVRLGALLLCVACVLGFGSAAVRADDASHWLISRDLLDHAKLTLVWQEKLPVKKGEAIEAMLAQGDRLYVRTARDYAWSLERGTGVVVFHRSIAPAGFPVLGWTPYENDILTVIDNQLVELNRDTGQEQRVSDLELSIIAPPVRNSRFFYLSASDRRLHALRAKDLVQLFQVAAENESQITSILADEVMVVFGTDAGNVIAIAADAPRKLWQFDAVEGIAGDVVRDGSSFYLASKDTHVYRIDMTEQGDISLTWKYQAEAILDRAPQVTAKVVYQYASGRGISAIDKRSGQALWFLPEGVDLLAEAADKAYILTKHKTLVVMDNIAGKKLYSVNFAPVAYHAANPLDAKIYVAGADGRVACLAPIQ